MRFQLEEAIGHLSRTPTVLRAMLTDVPELWVTSHYGEGTFSPFDIVGHLIHGEHERPAPLKLIQLE